MKLIVQSQQMLNQSLHNSFDVKETFSKIHLQPQQLQLTQVDTVLVLNEELENELQQQKEI